LIDINSIPLSGKVLIVGLGNPGKEYKYTRHNAGFLVIDKLAKTLKCKFSLLKFDGMIAECPFKNREVILLKPLTYMNLSGNSVKPALKNYKIPLENLLVIHDEIDLPLGKLKFKWNGGSTHKGILSIVNSLKTNAFSRLRIGISTPDMRKYVRKDFVLNEFTPSELEILNEVIDIAIKGILIFLEENLGKAMTEINRLEV
jgi:PTH1 family peptidyl-tRNA hydrolase